MFDEMTTEDENCRNPQLLWQPDDDTMVCMLCQIPFTLTRRRHHCRMCGKIFCGNCSQHKIPIAFLNNLIARVCLLCHKKTYVKNMKAVGEQPTESNPIHPVVGCKKFPPVVVSSSDGDKLLKRDLRECEIMHLLTNDELLVPVSFLLNQNMVVMAKLIKLSNRAEQSFWLLATDGLMTVGQDEIVFVLERQSEAESFPLDALMHFSRIYKEASFGHHQHHLGISESSIDGGSFFLHLDASRLFGWSSTDGRCDHRDHSLHPLHEIWRRFSFMPRRNFLLAVLLNSDERRMASFAPLRLMLRMALDQGYYPYPLISRRLRKSCYSQESRSILADLRDARPAIHLVPGLKIAVEGMSHVFLEIPRDAYSKIVRCLSENPSRIILYGDFDGNSCFRLTCDQKDDTSLTTSVASCSSTASAATKDHKVVDAMFLVIRAVAASSAVSSHFFFEIVEDGIVLDVSAEGFIELKSSLVAMKDHQIGSLNCENNNNGDNNGNTRQSFTASWTDKGETPNIDVTSEVDGRLLEGVRSSRIPVAAEETGVRFLERESPSCFFAVESSDAPSVRWSEVFFVELKIPDVLEDSFDVINFIRRIGVACCKALRRHAVLLDRNFSRLAVRLSVKEDGKITVESGSSSRPIPNSCHRDVESSSVRSVTDCFSGFRATAISLVLEFVFRVVSVESTVRRCPDLVLLEKPPKG